MESNAQKTIADIIAEKRELAEKLRWGTPSLDEIEAAVNLEFDANRIEAAWKREKAECEALALSVGGMVEASRHKPGGNAAAMRKALEKIGAMETPHNFQIERSDIVDACYDLTKAIKIAKAALSEPVKNCDVMDWRTAWAKWRAENHPQKPVRYSECYESTTRFMDWYMGTAEDRSTTHSGEEGGEE